MRLSTIWHKCRNITIGYDKIYLLANHFKIMWLRNLVRLELKYFLLFVIELLNMILMVSIQIVIFERFTVKIILASIAREKILANRKEKMYMGLSEPSAQPLSKQYCEWLLFFLFQMYFLDLLSHLQRHILIQLQLHCHLWTLQANKYIGLRTL